MPLGDFIERSAVDPRRAKQAEAFRVSTKRNSQNPQKQFRSIKVKAPQQASAVRTDPFGGSEYDESTLTNKEQLHAEDSQVDTQGVPYGHPAIEHGQRVSHEQFVAEQDMPQDERHEPQRGQFEDEPDGDEYETEYEEIEVDASDEMEDHGADDEIDNESHHVFTPNRPESMFPSTTSGDSESGRAHQRADNQAQTAPDLEDPGHLLTQVQSGLRHNNGNHSRKEQQQNLLQTAASSTRQNNEGSRFAAHGSELAHRQGAVPIAKQIFPPEHRHTTPGPSGRRNDCRSNQAILAYKHVSSHVEAAGKQQYGATSALQPLPIPQAQVEVEHKEQVLDYDIDRLKNMDYDELRTQGFDEVPAKVSSPREAVENNESGKSLNERLAAAQNMDESKKRELLTSLSLEEWEDAGDWFLERFGQILRKMKAARRERRKLAQDYEGEIAKRHERVQSKKRGIEEALSEMGKSGQSILRSGTPKKRVKDRA